MVPIVEMSWLYGIVWLVCVVEPPLFRNVSTCQTPEIEENQLVITQEQKKKRIIKKKNTNTQMPKNNISICIKKNTRLSLYKHFQRIRFGHDQAYCSNEDHIYAQWRHRTGDEYKA